MLPFRAPAMKRCVKTGWLCLCLSTTVLREGVGGWCLQAPRGTRQNDAYSWGPSSKIHLPQYFSAVLLGSASCLSHTDLLALSSEGRFG